MAVDLVSTADLKGLRLVADVQDLKLVLGVKESRK